VAAHPPACDALHLHGSITIARANGTGTDGPFQDPDIFYGDPCGHGKISVVPLDHIDFSAAGSISDGNPINGQFQLFAGVNGCDTGNLIDDTPVAIGSGPGQSSNPNQTITQGGNFNVPFTLNISAAQRNSDFCIRETFRDSAVNPLGQPANTVTKVQTLRLVDGN
jgi:hypothetical protein